MMERSSAGWEEHLENRCQNRLRTLDATTNVAFVFLCRRVRRVGDTNFDRDGRPDITEKYLDRRRAVTSSYI
jgi:hypothetical protein